jgi:hypothetical protein
MGPVLGQQEEQGDQREAAKDPAGGGAALVPAGGETGFHGGPLSDAVACARAYWFLWNRAWSWPGTAFALALVFAGPHGAAVLGAGTIRIV